MEEEKEVCNTARLLWILWKGMQSTPSKDWNTVPSVGSLAAARLHNSKGVALPFVSSCS